MLAGVGHCGKTGLATTFINKNCSEQMLLDLKYLLKEAKQSIPPVLMQLEDPDEVLHASIKRKHAQSRGTFRQEPGFLDVVCMCVSEPRANGGVGGGVGRAAHACWLPLKTVDKLTEPLEVLCTAKLPKTLQQTH